MKARNSPPRAPAPAPWNALAGPGRQQAAVVTECAAELFRGFEEMRKVQEQAAHAAAERHAAVAGKLKDGAGPGDLLALQAQLLQLDAEGAMRYWQQLGAAALEMQTRMLACLGRTIESEALLEAASAFDAATGRGA